ncbi:uncharacterized protein LOC126964575 [Leptidea sinapis]|uniref:uncharacterized protein LOC126964575 n=1 Tax=Leptidea sinapis TaxID=189913 RepID=UPI002133506F|nr:uncharacterized protein LOC126964575 [Leptidea sinapis]
MMKMKLVWKSVLLMSIWTTAYCSPFDDGKYKPKAYDEYDDGKYYRPPDEGKYVPGDEGKYTYIYTQGVFPYDGTYKHLGRGDSNEYIGIQIYAPRYPFIHRVIQSLVTKYVSPDIFVVDETQDVNYFDRFGGNKEVAMKCNLIDATTRNTTDEEVITQYPPKAKVEEGEKPGILYSFKGTKVMSTEKKSQKKLKLEYEVFVRVVEENEENKKL